ncbi:MAG: 2-amino-4-hydroxy-6-hydroxymethyldihydropteridine diphosphokinase [Deltaproteobacteria bacterium]|nr:2-amino-4-hydroxy-6-hydroxymethyldihydropteridine diphosphokinase [Deltaproteobacteria bacterium]|tara:strand:- start:927 stop:1448 length:522 start_codon:yes stop_codon:yes gene_type:complete
MTSEAILVHLGLGSNLGDRKKFLRIACSHLQSKVMTEFRVSSIYESEPLLRMSQPKYFNMVVCGLTVFSPLELLKKCQQIEIILGRIRRERWGSREIDIDILSYGSRIIKKNDLIIPHPEIENRSFVLMPMLELNPKWLHPEKGIRIKDLWENWLLNHEGQDNLPVKIIGNTN